MKNTDNIYSSAYTLSDMELFIFPDLLYAAVLANIISPKIWEWKKDPWFKNLDKMNTTKKIHRLKQFIMQKYKFNLDLETWGLTTQEKELERFEPFMSKETISDSNALFGYQGDKYYFSMNIRKHFGLDKYDSNIIPYWKTETIEAMDAFYLKPQFSTGAGECVSFSILYAAALFVILDIPLEDIFLVATPLHSQNFIMINDGLITNNRRIVTKNMWFNGTEISDKARRALANENVTFISHISGHIHDVYDTSTINPQAYEQFKEKIESYLFSAFNGEILANFLRTKPEFQKYFQFQIKNNNQIFFIKAESAYKLEENSKNSANKNTRKKLLENIETATLSTKELENRYVFETIESKVNSNQLDLRTQKGKDSFKLIFEKLAIADKLIKKIVDFIYIKPNLPQINNKKVLNTNPLEIKPGMQRTEIIQILEESRENNHIADLSFHTGRYCKNKEWPYFLKAAIERNPVSIEFFKDKSIEESYQSLKSIENKSIYSQNQYAQPDEIINYLSGDGIEKAFTLANVIINRSPKELVYIFIESNSIVVTNDKFFYVFESNKNIFGHFQLKYNQYNYHQTPIPLIAKSFAKAH
jgi:hypothetical protein